MRDRTILLGCFGLEAEVRGAGDGERSIGDIDWLDGEWEDEYSFYV